VSEKEREGGEGRRRGKEEREGGEGRRRGKEEREGSAGAYLHAEHQRFTWRASSEQSVVVSVGRE